METLGTLHTRSSRDVEDSPWGLIYDVPDTADAETLVARYVETGATWAPFDLEWSEVETAGGEYDFSTYDPHVEGLLDAGVSPVPRLDPHHPEYTEDAPDPAPVSDPAAREALTDYLRELAAHYDGVTDWIVYNEPNFPRNYRTDDPDFPTREDEIWPFERGATRMTPAGYADLVEVTSEALRSVDPDARILAGTIWAGHPDTGRIEYTREFLSQVDTDAFDVFDLHPYRHTPEFTIDLIDDVREVVHEHDPDLSIWQTESGMPSRGDTVDYRTSGPWGPRIQAKWLLRRLCTDRIADLDASAYFMLADYERTEVPDDVPGALHHRVGGVNAKGLLAYPDQEPKPGHAALGHFTTLVGDNLGSVDVEMGATVREEGSFHGIAGEDDRFPLEPYYLGYEDSDGAGLLYWLPWSPQERVDPATVDLRIDAPAIEDPVVVDLLSGEVLDPGDAHSGAALEELPLADYPHAVVDGDAIVIDDG